MKYLPLSNCDKKKKCFHSEDILQHRFELPIVFSEFTFMTVSQSA